jgi:hypothetical protein
MDEEGIAITNLPQRVFPGLEVDGSVIDVDIRSRLTQLAMKLDPPL